MARNRPVSALKGAVKDRLMARVNIDPGTGCWVMCGYLDKDGYANISVKRRTRRAHRVSYELFVGPIPENTELDHLCRNRACVNPEHLEPVATRENIMRGIGHASRNARATHCVNGHEFTPENTYRYGNRRMCKACVFERVRRRRAAV